MQETFIYNILFLKFKDYLIISMIIYLRRMGHRAYVNWEKRGNTMFYRILKKDLKHKRGINVILLLFMTMATVFVASSVNNILVISNAMDYCLEKGRVADKFVSAYEPEGDKNIGAWLDGNALVKDYSKNEAVILAGGNIESFNGKDGTEYDINGTIMLQSQWHGNMLIFDTQGNLVKMASGEIGMQQEELDRNGLKPGDEISMKFGDTHKTFKIAVVIVDPAFGGEFMGMTRYLVSDDDFEEIKDAGMAVNYNYNINTNDKETFSKAMNAQGFDIIADVDKDMFSFTYVMSMITAGILIIVGICLIVIAFLILRFTIVFTLQDEYKEIGIMKAIGIRNFMIKKIYLVKYLALVSIGAIAGCFLSIPVSNLMIQSVSRTMMMEDAGVNFRINIICSVGVAAIVMLTCYLCTNKLRKYSAIEAIRNGQTGERFGRKSVFSLYKSRRLSTTMFMALNDILSNIRRYVVLILIFVIGTIIIILPINAITSLGSDEMAKNFVIDLNADFYISADTISNDSAQLVEREVIAQNLNSMEDNFRSKGYELETSLLTFYSLSYYADNEEESYQLMTMSPLGTDGSYIELTAGTTPVNNDEIAFSEKAMEKMGVKIGDTVYGKVGNQDRKFIITASYQNFMQMGVSVLLSANADVGGIPSSGGWLCQCTLMGQTFNDDLLNQLRDEFPEYTFYNVSQALSNQLGSTVSQLDGIKVMLVILVCCINALITVLMIKIFILGEKSQIAMLRSIGYSLRAVRLWQVLRIGMVLVMGVFLGSVLSIPLNDIGLRPLFGMMGATHMKIQVDALQAYLLYPLLLLWVISVAAYLSTGSIKKMNLMEVNNAE